jgi:hypothetical protein
MELVFGIIILLMGILNVIIPEKMVMIKHIFIFKKGAEPTKFAYSITMVTGVVLMFIGGLLLYHAFF